MKSSGTIYFQWEWRLSLLQTTKCAERSKKASEQTFLEVFRKLKISEKYAHPQGRKHVQKRPWEVKAFTSGWTSPQQNQNAKAKKKLETVWLHVEGVPQYRGKLSTSEGVCFYSMGSRKSVKTFTKQKFKCQESQRSHVTKHAMFMKIVHKGCYLKVTIIPLRNNKKQKHSKGIISS